VSGALHPDIFEQHYVGFFQRHVSKKLYEGSSNELGSHRWLQMKGTFHIVHPAVVVKPAGRRKKKDSR
jgi:hypothetical protein